MKRAIGLLAIMMYLLPSALEANYVTDIPTPKYYAYLAVNDPEQLKRIIQECTQSSNPMDKIELRMIIAAMATDEFYDHKRALERLRDDHAHITIRNNGFDTIRLRYYKIKDASAATTTIASHRLRYLEPGKKNRVTLLKDKILTYRVQVPCSARCKQSGNHAHWSHRRRVSFNDGQSIELGALVKSASKQ